MPIYEFRCNACDNVFELFLSMNSSPEQVCPECGGTAFRILSRTVGFIKDSAPGIYNRESGSCDRSNPCCGREEPCDHKPCEDS